MRLANEIAARALEHTAAHLHPRMTESEAAALWQGWVRARHGPARARRPGARFLARLVRPGYPHVHRDREPADPRERADAVRDLGLRRRLLVRPYEEPRPRRPDAALPRAEQQLLGVYRATAIDHRPGASLPELDRLVRNGLAEIQVPGTAEPSDLPRGRRPRARTALRASGRHRHDRAGDGARDRAGRLLAGGRRPPCRGQLPDHGRRAGEALPLPGRDRARVVTIDRDKLWTARSTGARSSRRRTTRSASTTRRCETASRRWASCSRPRS